MVQIQKKCCAVCGMLVGVETHINGFFQNYKVLYPYVLRGQHDHKYYAVIWCKECDEENEVFIKEWNKQWERQKR